MRNAPLRITTLSLAGADACIRPPRQSLLFCRQAFIRFYDFRVVQLDDPAGKILQRVFLGDSAKRQPLGAESLCFQPGALVHLVVAVLDVAQYRMAQIRQMRTDLMGAARDQSDAAERKRPCGGAPTVMVRYSFFIMSSRMMAFRSRSAA